MGETFREGKILPTSMALSWRSDVVVEDGSGGMVQERRMHDAGAAGDGGAVQWRPRAGGTSRRSQPSLSIGLGFEVGTVAATVNLVGGAAGPHLLFMGLRDKGPPASF